MDEFVAIIFAFVDHTEDFDQAHETLFRMIEETPDDFINNLLTVITSSSDERLILNCINLLTIPITRNSGSFIRTVNSSNLQKETKDNIKQVLISFLNHPQKKIGDAAGQVLCFYVQFASEEKRELIKHMVSLIDPSNSESINTVFVETLSNLCKRMFFDYNTSIEMALHLFNYFSSAAEGNTDPTFPEKEKHFLSIIGEFCSCIRSFETHQEELMNIVGYMWMLTKEKYPVEGLESIRISMCNFGPLFVQIPDFIEGIFAFIQSDDEKIKFKACQFLNSRTYLLENGMYQCHNYITEGREVEVLGILIDFIANDTNTNMPENDSFGRLCINLLISHIFFSFQPIAEQLMQYFYEHIGSENEGERFVSLLLYDTYLDKESNPDEEITGPLQNIITTFLQDSSERIVSTTFLLFEKAVFREMITITEELHEIISQLCCSPSEVISSDAFEALIALLTKAESKEAKDQTGVDNARYMLQYLSTEIDDDERRANILRNINKICKYIEADAAATMIEPSFEFASELFSQVDPSDPESTVPLSLSPAIGFTYSVFSKACQTTNEETIQGLKGMGGDLFQFSTVLIENNFISDGLSLIEPLMKLFNGEEESILTYTLEFINQNLSSTENKEDFSAMLLICRELIPHLTQENHGDTLLMILETCLNYSNTNNISIDTCQESSRVLIDILVLIFNQYPDIVIERLHECIDLFYPGGIRFSYPSNENILKFVVSVAPNLEEDSTYARLVSDTLFYLGSQLCHGKIKSNFEEDLVVLLTVAHVCDPSGQIVNTVFNYYAMNYTTFIAPNVKSQEMQAKITSLLPEIPEQNHVVILE